jgi:hypothetical protein
MTTATYHPATGLGQDVWSQSIQQQYGQQPFGPIGAQGFGMPSFQSQAFQPQPFQPQAFQPQQGWQQPFGLPAGQQILAVLPSLIAQQAQQLYAIAQVCAQLAPTQIYQSPVPAYQFGLPQHQFGLGQQGQRPYPMGY